MSNLKDRGGFTAGEEAFAKMIGHCVQGILFGDTLAALVLSFFGSFSLSMLPYPSAIR